MVTRVYSLQFTQTFQGLDSRKTGNSLIGKVFSGDFYALSDEGFENKFDLLGF